MTRADVVEPSGFELLITGGVDGDEVVFEEVVKLIYASFERTATSPCASFERTATSPLNPNLDPPRS